MTLPESIKSIRKRLGLTMVQLAAHLGVDQSVVSRYEHGKTQPGHFVLMRLLRMADGDEEREPILEALGIPLAAFRVLGYEGVMQEIQRFDRFFVPRRRSRSTRAELLRLAKLVASDRANEVPSALVEILRLWTESLDKKVAEQVLENAATYIAIRLKESNSLQD